MHPKDVLNDDHLQAFIPTQSVDILGKPETQRKPTTFCKALINTFHISITYSKWKWNRSQRWKAPSPTIDYATELIWKRVKVKAIWAKKIATACNIRSLLDDLVFGSKFVQFCIICSLQNSININTVEVDLYSDSLHNGAVKPKNIDKIYFDLESNLFKIVILRNCYRNGTIGRRTILVKMNVQVGDKMRHMISYNIILRRCLYNLW